MHHAILRTLGSLEFLITCFLIENDKQVGNLQPFSKFNDCEQVRWLLKRGLKDEGALKQ